MPVSTVNANVKPSVSSTASKLSAKDKDEDILFNNSAKQSTVKSNDKSDKTIVDYVMDFFDGIVNFFTGSKNNKKDNESKTDETKKTDDISKSDETKKSDKTTSATVKSEIEAPSGDGKMKDKASTNENVDYTLDSKINNDPNSIGSTVFSNAAQNLGKNYSDMINQGMQDVSSTVPENEGVYWCAGFVDYCIGDKAPDWYQELRNKEILRPTSQNKYDAFIDKYPQYANFSKEQLHELFSQKGEEIKNKFPQSNEMISEPLDYLVTYDVNGEEISREPYNVYSHVKTPIDVQNFKDVKGNLLFTAYIYDQQQVQEFNKLCDEYNELEDINYPDTYVNLQWDCNNVWDAAEKNDCTYEDVTEAKRGDLVLFDTDRGEKRHIGVVDYVEYDENTGEPLRLHTIEGNTWNKGIVETKVYDCKTGRSLEDDDNAFMHGYSGFIRM